MPVRFARLRIAGFKSFAEPASVEIRPGLTGIVGPNGCGKSNVVEALRWSKEAALSFMDDAEIDVAVTSISSPGVHVGDDARARSLARRCNELSAELVQTRPDRFGGFACVPLPDVDGALAEVAYALDVLKLDGVVLFSNARGIYLGDPETTTISSLGLVAFFTTKSQLIAQSRNVAAKVARP